MVQPSGQTKEALDRATPVDMTIITDTERFTGEEVTAVGTE